ncbi:LSM12 homolog A [Drosophila grimshawi]|uniref:GH15409 n=1 Tax=Drosophila grimshawi TaxID=7222 RepID=B4J2T6_DROGR|nr:LSM12 homolog A [Drosophila grimshawi]EDV96077.1 GH15409 [Drosophila grimshawi]
MKITYSPFPAGTQLHVETCFGDHITGDVVTYEHSVKMLILNCYAKDNNGKKCCNRTIVNLNYCKNLQIIKEAKMPDSCNNTPDSCNNPPVPLNCKLLNARLQQSVVQRESLLRSRSKHATPRAHQLLHMLSKHFGQHELSWQLDNIMVLQQITIAPPYRNCDISSKQKMPKLLDFVHRVVERFNAQNKQGGGRGGAGGGGGEQAK